MRSKEISRKIGQLNVKRLVADMDNDQEKVAALTLLIAEAEDELAQTWVMEKLESNL